MKDAEEVSEIEVRSLLSEVKTPAMSERGDIPPPASRPVSSAYTESIKSSQLLARSPESLKYTTDK